jgi:hypothetical protein
MLLRTERSPLFEIALVLVRPFRKIPCRSRARARRRLLSKLKKSPDYREVVCRNDQVRLREAEEGQKWWPTSTKPQVGQRRMNGGPALSKRGPLFTFRPKCKELSHGKKLAEVSLCFLFRVRTLVR